MKIKLLKLSKSQIIIVSEISRDIAQILFASTVITPILVGIDQINWAVVLVGMFLCLNIWIFSVIIIRR